jgi:hypothetical protein
MSMKIIINSIARHRNGISGAPFHVVLFSDPDEGRMLGIVFDLAHHVAVFNLDKLALGNIAFGVNSWRGDRYEPSLRHAINSQTDTEDKTYPIDLHHWHAERKEIANVWMIEDVLSIRPDLTEEQAWEVLQVAESRHDATIGINWDVLDYHAQSLFGEAPDDPEESPSDEGEA